MLDCSRALDMLPEPRSMVTFATVADMKQFVERTTETSLCLATIHDEKGLEALHEIRGEIEQLCPDSELLEDCDMLEESISVLLNRLAEEEELCRMLSGEIVGLIRIAEAVQSISESLERSEADLDDMLSDDRSLDATRIGFIKTAVADVIGMLQQQLPESIPPAVANELHRSRELAERITGRLEACDRYFQGDAQLNQMQARIDSVKDNMTAISQFVPEALGAVIQAIDQQLDAIDVDLKQLKFPTAEANEDGEPDGEPDGDGDGDDDFSEDISDMLNIRKIDLMEELLRTRSAFAQAKEDAYRTKRTSFAVEECRRYVQVCLTVYREHTTEREKRLARALVDAEERDAVPDARAAEDGMSATIQEIELGFEKLQAMCTDGFEAHENIEKMLDEAERARDDVRSAIDLGRSLDAMLTRYGEMVAFHAGVMKRIDKARASLPADGQYTSDTVKEPELMKIGSEIMRITADDCTALCDSIDEYSRSDFVLASELAGLDRFRMHVHMNYTRLMAAWNTLKAELESLRSDGNVNEQRLLCSRNISMAATRVNELHAAMLDATHDPWTALEQLQLIQAHVREQAEQLDQVLAGMAADDLASFEEEGRAVMEQLEQLDELTASKIRDAELMEQFEEELCDLDDHISHLLNRVDESIVEAAAVTERDEIEMLIQRLSMCLGDAETEIPQRLADISSLAASINGRVASEEFSKFEKQWHETRSFAAKELEALRKKRIHKSASLLETLPGIAEDAAVEEGNDAAATSSTTTTLAGERKHRRTHSNTIIIGGNNSNSNNSSSTMQDDNGYRPRRRSSSVTSATSDKSPHNARDGFKWIRPMLVHPSPNHYVPDASDKLDVRVASIINECHTEIKIERTAQSGRYLIGDLEPKTIFCRMLNDRMVMVRVGGGWVELSRFLSTHAASLHKLVPIQQGQQPASPLSPLYPIRLPAKTLPTTPSSPGLMPRGSRASTSNGPLPPKSPRRTVRSPSLSPKMSARSISSPGATPLASPQMSRSQSKDKAANHPLCRTTTDGNDMHIRMAIRMEQSFNRQ
ncbi:hypothetical protein SYNPS1DRAFT_23048 [Syncephalis pseudoplumigaleata]|uniref:GAR domain-containing protein n=1 Tax=Syncephalis pseudoplumigaleata TaxID=1712513 RepID=A0A4P9Z0M8_9FUNG|nr:hypothetical protein SYNPS1DRAFT_23048 [Syncephalis pseudoplumigaleata]|eukprot:RKP24910.1 hypothetical protein SYNPS1DRAFT_23048 [Syncephalis pseudoplumigaleata]